jgi:hypothetical protein
MVSMTLSADTTENSSPPARRIDGWRWLIVLLAVSGVILVFWQPIWLTPPNFAGSMLFFIVLLFLWVPVLIGSTVLWRNRVTILGIIIFVVLVAGEVVLAYTSLLIPMAFLNGGTTC